MIHELPRFLMGIEQECLTVCEQDSETTLREFIAAYAKLTPSLPDLTGRGCFNSYGRVYVDGGPHVELATAEADTPEQLLLLIEQQQYLAGIAMQQLCAQGLSLTLANNNYSGLLSPQSAAWGNHVNYLVHQHPSDLADRLLPFLASCPFGGAGGLVYPSGLFVNTVRSQFMDQEIGGGTTRDRAMISTTRNEHHAGAASNHFRLHLILFDGQRSQWSIYLRMATTALVLQALVAFPEAVVPMPPGTRLSQRRFWSRAMKFLNQLASPGQPPHVHPLVIQVQQFYLTLAQRWADSVLNLPTWVPVALQRWHLALTALVQQDDAWLATHLDPWIKHTLFSAWLHQHGRTWSQLPDNRGLFSELALLDLRYHMFGDTNSPFTLLDRAGVLQHRLVDFVRPGTESSPYVPNMATRAQARARFLTQAPSSNLLMDWSAVHSPQDHLARQLSDPFATEYSPWQPAKTILTGHS